MRARTGIVAVWVAATMVILGAQAAEVTYALRIENGRLPADKRLIRVQQGDLVKLQWSADRRTVLHLHGYDIEQTVEPGATAEMTFAARAAGRFTVEPHADKAASGGQANGAILVTIEVRP